MKQVHQIFSAGRGRLIDEEGIDWWDLMSLVIAPDALAVVVLQKVRDQIDPAAEAWATRQGGVVGVMAVLLGRAIQSFGSSVLDRSMVRVMHYAGLARRFSAAQIKEIFLDKYDSSYKWRSRFAERKEPRNEPVVLLPSAYGNVSRMAAEYARGLPGQSFLMVVTRDNAKHFVAPSNVQVRDLASYAKAMPTAEIASMLERWAKLRADLQSSPELRVLSETGAMGSFIGWIRDGLSARNAWRKVLECEPVCGVLCGDDSNIYTRVPVLLAARRKIPTVDFHHGALDGRYVMKELPCDVYLAKNEMERDYLLQVCGLPAGRVQIGAPAGEGMRLVDREHPQGTSVVLFSEPYEAVGMRGEEVYGELLPPLCRLARENGRSVIIKLHPFESRSQRNRMLSQILNSDDRALVKAVDGPLTAELMAQAWFGITVESTTAIDCLQNGICCFLCRWLTLSPYEYAEQYARFGVGEGLQDVTQIADIPKRLVDFHGRGGKRFDFSMTVDPAMMQRWLTSAHESSGVRSAS